MRCSCPKCSANISIDLPEVPTEGAYLHCPECSASVHVRRESFARRAMHNSTDISCAECGSGPGSSIYCQHCHAIYPDYLVAETSSATKKQLTKFLSRLHAVNRTSVPSPQGGHEKVARPQKVVAGKGIKLPSKPIQLAAVLLILLAVIGGGGYLYNQHKMETTYTANFVRAILGLNSAKTLTANICAKLANDWRTKQTAPAPRPSTAEQTSINRAKNDVDYLLKRLDKTPKKFAASNAALVKLYDSYAKLHALALSPAGSPDSFTNTVNKLDEEFRRNATELKAGLPESLSTGLNSAKAKYKQLQDF